MLLWIAAAFVSGSLMFSYWIGLAVKRDLREVGDGNPGGINLWKAAGVWLGLAGIALDFAKGYLPVWLMLRYGPPAGYGLALAAAAPVMGHLFSPFMKFKGGKGIAVTFGVWSALTAFRASLALAVVLLALHLLFKKMNQEKYGGSDADGFQVCLGMLLMPAYLYFAGYPAPVHLLWLLNFMLILYAHRNEVFRFLGIRQLDPKRQEKHGRQIGG